MSEPTGAPEITVRAVVLGIVLSVVLAGANAYLGLFAGMTVSASIPAAVVSMGILRILRRGGILENNIVQTAASAGESLAAGVIFTLPALVILDFWTDFDVLWVTLIAALGGMLGVLFTIPLRRSLILEQKLHFPEGVATAEVLRSGQRGGRALGLIAQSAVVGGLFKLGESGLRIWSGVFETGARVGGSIAYVGSNLSPALLSVGYIVGLNIAVLIFLGGLGNWLIAIPICAVQSPWPVEDGSPVPAVDFAHRLWSTQTRYIGVGGMLVGGLWTIVHLRGSLVRGVRTGLDAYRRAAGGETIAKAEQDLPMNLVVVLTVAAVVPILIVYQVFVQQVSVSVPMAAAMLVTGFLFSAVAGYMAGLVGSSNNPISGVTIATVVVASLMLVALMGKDAANGPAAAIVVGSVVCCAAAIAGDTMQDLKAGHLVGATPWKQQVMQMIGTASAALVMAPILMLLLEAYGFKGHSSAKDSPLIAAQANLMASVARGVFGGGLPWRFVGIGAGVASGVLALDRWLEARGSTFRTPVLAVAIGFYLPFQLAVPIFAGGLIKALVMRRRQARHEATPPDEPSSDQSGLLLASGLITGEALVGIVLAIPIVVSGRPDVLAILADPIGSWPGIVLLAGVGAWLYGSAVRRGASPSA